MAGKFKVRDLLIQVLPDESSQVGGSPAAGCGICTLCTHCSGCTVATCFQTCGPTCGACTIVSTPGGGGFFCACSCSCFASIGISIVDPNAESDPGRGLTTLRLLKEQLRESLRQVEHRENVLLEGLKPQTREEVDLLEQRLSEAQEELRGWKKKASREGD